jgi:hypothetical protein
VKLQRFAAEARVLNVARMKELTEEKRFALAAALLFRQLARAYDDAADMLIRQVQRIHYKAKELMDIRQASHLQQSAELVSTLRNITIAYQQEGPAEQRLHAIGALLGQDPNNLLERCEEYAALAEWDLLAALAAVLSSSPKCIAVASRAHSLVFYLARPEFRKSDCVHSGASKH